MAALKLLLGGRLRRFGDRVSASVLMRNSHVESRGVNDVFTFRSAVCGFVAEGSRRRGVLSDSAGGTIILKTGRFDSSEGRK